MAATDNASVAIITVTYKAAPFILDYLKSVAQLLKRDASYHLFLVDNASPDDTCARAQAFVDEELLSDRITVLPQEGNLGFGRGCNAGAAAAAEKDAHFLWFLNPDTTIEPDSGDVLRRALAAEETIQFAGSTLKNERGVKRSGAFRFPRATTTFLSNARIGVLDKTLSQHTSTHPLPSEPVQVDWLSGASFMVKRSAFEALKGFDPHYFLYFEEVDLFYRAKQAGFQSWSYPESVIYHISGASTGINKKNTTEIKPRPSYWFESRSYFYQKNFGPLYAFWVDVSFTAGQILFRFKNLVTRRRSHEPPGLLRGIFRHNVVIHKATPQKSSASN